ncbi:hypothetical protein ARSEF1564_009927 [Beauveria bassiana]
MFLKLYNGALANRIMTDIRIGARNQGVQVLKNVPQPLILGLSEGFDHQTLEDIFVKFLDDVVRNGLLSGHA